MSGEEKEEKVNDIDEYFEEMRKKNHENITKALNSMDEITDEENQDHMIVNVFQEGQDAFYDSFAKQLKTDFDDDQASTHNKEKELKRAVVKGLEPYFDKVMPSINKAIKEAKVSEEDRFEFLVNAYDEHRGAGRIEGVKSLKDLVKGFAKMKKGKVIKFKRQLYNLKAKHTQEAYLMLENKALNYYLGSYQPHEIGAHMKPIVEKGYTIEDHVRFHQMGVGDHFNLRQKIIKGTVGEDDLANYGLEKKKKEGKIHDLAEYRKSKAA